MNGGALPPLLLGAALALMLSFAPRRVTMVGLTCCAAAALAMFFVPLGLPAAVIYVGLWSSVVVTAAMVYLPTSLWAKSMLLLCVNAGFWIGAYSGVAGRPAGLVVGLLIALAGFPAKWLIVRKFDIIIKVVASWLIAIASLSMFVSLMPTPGYKPDHME